MERNRTLAVPWLGRLAALTLALAAMTGCSQWRPAPPRSVLFSYGGVRFLVPADLSINMRVEAVDRRVLVRPDDPFDSVAPAHLDVTLLDYDVDLRAIGLDQGESHRPAHAYFYPTRDASTEDFARAYPPVAVAAEKLQALLDEPFLTPVRDVPVLPWTGGETPVQMRCHRLRFQNGGGFAFLARHPGVPAAPGGEARDTGAAAQKEENTEEELDYVFQGLTDDGLIYAAAAFPVRLALSPPEPAPEPPGNAPDADAPAPNDSKTTGTLTQPVALATDLESLAPTDFVPNLGTLDAVFRSIALDLPQP